MSSDINDSIDRFDNYDNDENVEGNSQQADDLSISPDGQDLDEEMVSRSELEKVIRQRQQAKQRVRDVQQQLEQLSRQSDDAEIENLKNKLTRSTQRLGDMLKTQALRAAASKAGAVNPDQVVSILKDRVVAAENSDGDIELKCFDESGELLRDTEGCPAGADALVVKLLSEDANANLLLPGALSGSGARPLVGESDSAISSLNNFNQLPPQRRRQAALTMTRAQREKLLGIGRNNNGAFL